MTSARARTSFPKKVFNHAEFFLQNEMKAKILEKLISKGIILGTYDPLSKLSSDLSSTSPARSHLYATLQYNTAYTLKHLLPTYLLLSLFFDACPGLQRWSRYPYIHHLSHIEPLLLTQTLQACIGITQPPTCRHYYAISSYLTCKHRSGIKTAVNTNHPFHGGKKKI